MSKKEKKSLALAEDFQALTALVSKLEVFLKVYKEIATGYQKYRKNGGEAIPGIEKHLGILEQASAPAVKKKEVKSKTDAEPATEDAEAKKTKKKKGKNP